MSYGTLTRLQERALKPFLKKARLVHDLGCGNLQLTNRLRQLGAKNILAVDKHPPEARPYKGVTFRQAYFDDLVREETALEFVFLSWPINSVGLSTMMSVHELIRQARTVVYLGKNTDGTACGWPALFDLFLRREVLAHVPHRSNTLAIYGFDKRPAGAGLLPEEHAGQQDKLWLYPDLMSEFGMLKENKNGRSTAQGARSPPADAPRPAREARRLVLQREE